MSWLVGGIHAASGVLQRTPEAVLEAWLARDAASPRLASLRSALAAARLTAQEVPAATLTRMAGHDRHQGVLLRCRPPPVGDEGDLAAVLESRTEPLLLLLDQVTDPHNLGACLRSAAAFAVDAVVIPRDRSAGLTEVVARSAAGTLGLVPVLAVTNLARSIVAMQQAGVFVHGLAGEAELVLADVDLRGRSALVLGAEGQGLRQLTRQRCDRLLRIPMAAGVESLNVAVAAGICLYEAARQRR